MVNCLFFVRIAEHIFKPVDLVFSTDGRSVGKRGIWLRGRLTISLALSKRWNINVLAVGDIDSIGCLLLKGVDVLVLVQFAHLVGVNYMFVLDGDLLNLLDHFDHLVEDRVNLLMGVICFTLVYFHTSIILLAVLEEFIYELDGWIIDEFPILLLVSQLLDPLQLHDLFSKKIVEAFPVTFGVLLAQDPGLTV